MFVNSMPAKSWYRSAVVDVVVVGGAAVSSAVRDVASQMKNDRTESTERMKSIPSAF